MILSVQNRISYYEVKILITRLGIKKILFWMIMLFFLVTNFIRIFINSNFGDPIKEYFRDFPFAIKVIIVILYILLLIYLFPYKNNNKKTIN
jgi:uncharacterized membrane protein